MAFDPYGVLGVRRDASTDEIKRAYRRLARELHPDANPDDEEAEARFKDVAHAWEILRDPEKRRRYDLTGDVGGTGAAGDPFGFGGGISDIFDAFFGGGSSPFGGGGGRGGPVRGPDVEAVLELSFTEAVFGAEKQVSVRTAVPCDTCEATGARPGTTTQSCVQCGGAGQVRQVRQSLLGQMVTSRTCPRCEGRGEVVAEPCDDCAGEGRRVEEKRYTVEIPAGVDTGSTLRLTGRGAVGPRGGPAGDLYVHCRVAAHERFRRDDHDLVCELPVAVTQAMLGAEIELETLDGVEVIRIEPGTRSGHEIVLRGLGVPVVNRRSRGDLRVRVEVVIPRDLDEEQEELVRRLAALRGDDVAAEDAGFFSKLRSAFRP